jgi:hypothetical protein
MLPLRRRDELIIQQVSDETLVYDERNARAHCLNRAAAEVWERCDGRSSVEQIAASLSSDRDVVRLAIRKLEKAHLLDSSADEQGNISRRDLARRLGLVAAALPLVISIVSPTPALAASCVPRGGVCGEGNDQQSQVPCCGGRQCNNNRCV